MMHSFHLHVNTSASQKVSLSHSEQNLYKPFTSIPTQMRSPEFVECSPDSLMFIPVEKY